MTTGRVVDLTHEDSFSRLPELSTRILSPRDTDRATLTVDELPHDRFVGRAIVVSALGFPAQDVIGFADVSTQLDGIQPGDIVLFHTGWDVHYQTPIYDKCPTLDPSIAAALIVRGVLAIGIDTPRVDPIDSVPGPVAHMFAAASGVLCVNLCRLDQVDFANPLVSLVPGSPVNPTSSHVHASAFSLG